ncbi:HalD/BesD family halogenase [Ruegeria atlantica]|uniref:HalD/BesD family halogenase n=1 Tax=Ruegeria atlantica TaxID=81569 RepID=UPI00147BB210|nr:2OG-Fe(II) oxygenase [Ruegeria atlantica]
MTDTSQSKRDVALDFVDLDRYPIADLDNGPGAELLAQCQLSIDTNGWCNLDGFLHSKALKQMNSEANTLLPTAEILHVKRNIYQGAIDPSLPDDDPRRKEFIHSAVQLADDQIPAESGLKQLYQSEILTEFVRRVQMKDQLYRCADEFQALNVVALQPGSGHAWHYDTTECTVTLLLQAAEKGGEFTFIPNSRTDSDEDREAVDRLLDGDLSHAQTFARGAGTLTLFRGGYSLHGVTKVEGDRPRITATMTYDEQPDREIGDEINIRIYGKRVENILASRKAETTG